MPPDQEQEQEQEREQLESGAPRSLLCVSRVVRAWAYEEVMIVTAHVSMSRAALVEEEACRVELGAVRIA